MKKIYAKPITRDNFRRYGDFSNIHDSDTFSFGFGRGTVSEFFPDVFSYVPAMGPQSISICNIGVREMLVDMIESHNNTDELFLVLGGDAVFFAGYTAGNFEADSLEAFIVPDGTMVRINRGVLHGAQYAISNPICVVVMLPERVFVNDLHFVTLEGDDRIRLVL